MAENDLYLRRASLMLVDGDRALDLSEMHFRFKTAQQDEESPNSCAIRVWNLSDETVRKIRGEYSRVVVQAGYVNSAFGVVFDGTVRQYRIGKENDNLSTYLHILAPDGDVPYNYAVVNKSLAAGVSASERVAAVVEAMTKKGARSGQVLVPGTGGVLPRGKVLFGLARAAMRQEVAAQGSTWNISNGEINVVPLDGYLPNEVVV